MGVYVKRYWILIYVLDDSHFCAYKLKVSKKSIATISCKKDSYGEYAVYLTPKKTGVSLIQIIV